jgi:DNA-binding response OmpR family regulator
VAAPTRRHRPTVHRWPSTTRGSTAEARARVTERAPSRGVTGLRAARRILIVDDEPNIRSFIGRALAAAGYLIGFAGSGSEGLRHALDEHYDLVILDLVMPDMDGCNVLDQLLRARPDQTVMVLSCVADVATKVDCLERGARDYLTKPFSLAELLVRIRVRLREDAHLRGEARPGEAAGEIIRAGNLTLGRGAPGRRHRARAGAADPAGSSCCCASWRSTSASRYPRASCWPACGVSTSTLGSNVVDVCVRRLRSKLGYNLIKTVRGEGYQLAAS